MNLDCSENYLSRDDELMLLRIARDSLATWVRDDARVDLHSYPIHAPLTDHHGAFVTLRNQGELRGCIGSTANDKPLAMSVADNAVNAASRDPRFDPVREEELPAISIEISALTPGDAPETPFKRVTSIDEIIIGRDGLYIVQPPRRGGLLLPQVPIDRRWDVETFLRHTCLKAGYPPNAWLDPATQIFRFSAQVFSE